MKRTRYKNQIAEQRGTTLEKDDNYTLTENNILRDGNAFIKMEGAKTLTLPAASSALKGITVLVFGDDASSQVAVAAGFGGGGASYDTVTIGAYNSSKFWCDGTYWYALNLAVAAA